MPISASYDPDAVETPQVMAITARRLPVASWLARTAGLIVAFGTFATMASAVISRGVLVPGFPSWTIDCQAFAHRLKFWYSFTVDLTNSFLTPDEQHCQELLAGPLADPRVGVAYSIALFHRGATVEALSALEKEALRGRTPAVHALASLYLDPTLAQKLGVAAPIDRAISVLRRTTYPSTPDSSFLLFRALNMSQNVENAPEAALSLLRSLTQRSEAAMAYLQSIPIGGEQTHLQPATKKAIKSILRALHFTEAVDDDFAAIEDYIALVKFIEAKPEVRDDDCIVALVATACPSAWRWRLVNEISKRRLQLARSVEELADAVVYTATEILEVPQSQRSPEVLQKLRSSVSLNYAIGALYLALRTEPPPTQINDCDRLTAHPYDPHRIGKPVDFETIDTMRAIAACERAITEHGPLPRLLYQRGRAHSRAQHVAASKNDAASLRLSASLAKADLEAAAEMGYPMAFSHLASDLEGSSEQHVRDKAASLYQQALARTLLCCWTLLARKLLEIEPGLRAAESGKVVRVFTTWSAALGNADATPILERLGEPSPAPAALSDTPAWLLRGP